MKLSEYLADFHIFDELDKLGPVFPFEGVSSQMDDLLIFEHGQKTVFEGVLNLSKPAMVSLVMAKFKTRWDALVERELLLGNVNDRSEKTEKTNKTEEKVNESSGVTKVSAFNSDLLVDNGGNTSQGTDGLTGETVKTIVDEKIDVKKAFNMLNVNARDTIMTTVVSDVSGFLTLSIY